MKTMTRVVAVTLVAVMMCMMLASCSTISGKYSGTQKVILVDVKYTYEFSGKNVTLTTETPALLGGTITFTQTGTYEIKDDQITFTWDVSENKDGATVVDKGPYAFEKGSDYIKIGEMTLTKEK